MSDKEPALDVQRIALLTQQVSHYHAARYRAAGRRFADLRVLSLKNSADFQEFLSSDADLPEVVRLFDGERAYCRAVVSGAVWKRVQEELDSYVPQVIAVAGWSFPESLAAIEWARRHDARLVLMSDSQSRDAPRTSMREAFKRRVVSACDSALVAAGPHAEYVASLGVPGRRVFFGYDVVDNEYFARGADRARSDAEAFRTSLALPERYLLACGRFIDKKNFPRLVEAFALALREEDRGHDLVILGDGPARTAVESAAQCLGIRHRLRLPGFRGYDALPVWYGLAEGFAHVALSEQWGLVINEAAAAALPLVVSRPCGAAALLVKEGDNGFLVDPINAADIAAALGRLMRLDDDERRRMGVASRGAVSHWGPERFADGLLLACRAALSCPTRPLGFGDRVLLRALARLRITKVS